MDITVKITMLAILATIIGNIEARKGGNRVQRSAEQKDYLAALQSIIDKMKSSPVDQEDVKSSDTTGPRESWTKDNIEHASHKTVLDTLSRLKVGLRDEKLARINSMSRFRAELDSTSTNRAGFFQLEQRMAEADDRYTTRFQSLEKLVENNRDQLDRTSRSLFEFRQNTYTNSAEILQIEQNMAEADDRYTTRFQSLEKLVENNRDQLDQHSRSLLKIQDTLQGIEERLQSLIRMVDSSAVRPQESTTTTPARPLKCPSTEWELFQGSCYLIKKTNFKFKMAQRFCQSKGSHLVAVESREEEVFLVGKNASYFWLGVMKGTDGVWKWQHNQSPVVYSNWERQASGEHCAVVWFISMYRGWVTLDCDIAYRSPDTICETDVM